MSGRRGRREGSVYQRKADGRWCAAVTLPGGGRKVFYAPRDENTRAAVAAILRREHAKLETGVAPVDERTTVTRYLIDRWLPSVEKRKRERTYVSYAQVVEDHIAPHVGKVRLTRLQPDHVEGMMDALEDDGVTPHSVNYTRVVLRIALGKAVKWRLLQINVASLVDARNEERRPIAPLTVDQVLTLLGSLAEDDPMRTFYLLAVTTALRLGELIGMRWEDVNLPEAQLHIRRQVQRLRAGLQEVETKTKGSTATIALAPITVEALAAHKAAQSAIAGYVFPASSGGPMDPSNVRRHWLRTLGRAGLPHRRLHDLRHSTATFLLEAGVDAKIVQTILRHASLKTTGDVYQHVSPALQREAMARLSDLLRNPQIESRFESKVRELPRASTETGEL